MSRQSPDQPWVINTAPHIRRSLSVVNQLPAIATQPLAVARLTFLLLAADFPAAHILTKWKRVCQLQPASFLRAARRSVSRLRLAILVHRAHRHVRSHQAVSTGGRYYRQSEPAAQPPGTPSGESRRRRHQPTPQSPEKRRGGRRSDRRAVHPLGLEPRTY